MGLVYKEADKRAIFVSSEEWMSLKWEPLPIKLLSDYEGVFMSSLYDVANFLGYKPFAKLNTLDYCYSNGTELIVLRGPGNVIMSKLPKKIEDAIDNDNIVTDGTHIGSTWLTTTKTEKLFGLPKGSVKRDIHRKKFNDGDAVKIGRDWIINRYSAEKLYSK